MSWNDPDKEDTRTYKVVMNQEEQYSIWLGRTRIITGRRVKKVVEMTLRQKLAHATHWSTRTMAAAAGISDALFF